MHYLSSWEHRVFNVFQQLPESTDLRFTSLWEGDVVCWCFSAGTYQPAKISRLKWKMLDVSGMLVVKEQISLNRWSLKARGLLSLHTVLKTATVALDWHTLLARTKIRFFTELFCAIDYIWCYQMVFWLHGRGSGDVFCIFILISQSAHKIPLSDW